MTIEEKAKAYDEAFEKAKDNYNAADNVDINVNSFKNTLIAIFPQLEESEDEKIRKWIINEIKIKHHNLDEDNVDFVDKAIAYLEKQDNQESINIDIDAMIKVYKERFLKNCKTTGDYAFVNACATAFKQGIENTLDELNLRNFINKSKENNKSEPKFKVGYWITNGACTIQITSIDDRYYWHNNDCVGGDIESIDKEYHLWTIDDAKDGDIIVDSSRNIIILFRKIGNKKWANVIDYYVAVGENYFDIQKGVEHWGDKYNKDLKPANKEQRNLLFQKINKEGYKWYPNSKELYKLIRIHYD